MGIGHIPVVPPDISWLAPRDPPRLSQGVFKDLQRAQDVAQIPGFLGCSTPPGCLRLHGNWLKSWGPSDIPWFAWAIGIFSDALTDTDNPGCRIGRLKIIFRLPTTINRDGIPCPSPSEWPIDPLAYISWFTHFKTSLDKNMGMYHIQPAKDSTGQEQGCIVPLSNVRQGCMLTPSRATWDSTWNPENILDKCDSFFVNNLQSKYSYQTIY